MRIRVTDWKYRNIRGLGSHSIELELPPKRWSLVQMPNGTGKTTTMELIRAVLSEQRLTADDVRSFRVDDSVKNGAFELGMLIDNKPYRLTLDFNYESGEFKRSTLRPNERGGGRVHGRALPPRLKYLLKPQFIRLFVFDGELAKQIRAVDKTEADRAIKTLYQLDELQTLRGRIDKVVQKRQDAVASVSSAKSSKGVSLRRNALKEAKRILAKLEHKLSTFKNREAELKQEADAAEDKIKAHIAEHGDLKEEEQKISTEADQIRSKMQSAIINAMRAFRMPTSLSLTTQSRLTELGKTLTDARLPRSVSSEFFSELAQKDECICARPIGIEERRAIYQRKDKYLAQDQIGVISAMKENLNNSQPPEVSFQSACGQLRDLMKSRRENNWRRDRLLQSLADADDGEVASLSERLENIGEELVDLHVKIEKLQTKNLDRQQHLGCSIKNNISLAKKRVDECQKKFEVASNSYQLARQRDILVNQLKEIENRTLNTLRNTIRKETNKRLGTLVQMEQLRVSKIDGALSLTSDFVAERSSVSEGQSLSVAYAFLTSLLSEAPFELPFIVDSPAVSLDLDVRREVGRIIPGLFEQMIMFVISSEQAGFADTFFDRMDTCFVSLSKASSGGVICEYGVEAFKKRAEEAPTI